MSSLYNFQDIMNRFYSYEPKDDAGKATKASFQANFVQSGIDAALAQQMAYINQGIATGAMKTAADLEARNQAQTRQDEFNYGMSKMGAEFDLQSRFSAQQQGYALDQMDRAGEIKRDQTRLEGEETRLNVGTEGAEDRKTIAADTVRQTTTLAAKGEEDRALTRETGMESRKNIAAQGDVDIEKIGKTGFETRETMKQQTRETAKDRANQSMYARNLAATV